MSPDIYTTCLIVFAAQLLYFGMYLSLGRLPHKLEGSVYEYARKFMGLAYLVLVFSIVIFFVAGVNRMERCYRIALNLSCYYVAAKLIAISFFTLVGKMPVFSQLIRKRGFALVLMFPILIWLILLIPNKNIVLYLYLGCGIILLASIILDVKTFFARYKQVIAQGEYFYTEGLGVHISWMLHSLYSMIGAGLLCAVFALLSTILPEWVLFIYLSYFLGVCIFVFNNFIHFMTTFSELVVMSGSYDTLPEIDMSKIRLSPDTYQSLHKQVAEWVESKAYCEKRISIMTLAAAASTNRLYLSNYINTTYQCSYRVWISRLRVEEAKRLFIHNQNETITSVADRVGFLSLTSFTHAFKQIEGASPSDWLKTQKR